MAGVSVASMAEKLDARMADASVGMSAAESAVK